MKALLELEEVLGPPTTKPGYKVLFGITVF
jgi:hypothetical protein